MLALFLALGLAICAASYLALRLAVLPTFEEFERQAAANGLSRIESLFESRLEALKVLNVEYSAWDDTVDYMKGEYDELVEEELSPGYWNSINISALAVFDRSEELHYGWILDPEDGTQHPFEAMQIEPIGSGHVLAGHESASSYVTGLLRTTAGAMIVASFPILNSEGRAPIHGTLTIGQFLTDELVADLGRHATIDLSIHVMGEKGLPSHIVAAFREYPNDDTTIVAYSEFVHGLKVLRDVHGDPAAVVEIRQPRRISRIGVDTIRTTMLFLAIGSLGFLLAALFFTRRLIVSPIHRLTEKIVRIRQTGKLDFDAGDARADEVGVLAMSFEDLTAGLRHTREELEAARDEALSMSKAKSEFLARMSHEIRTPMNGVLGMTELLQNTSLDDKQERFARTIYSSAESLLHIINDILDISKIEAGKLELDIAPFNLRLMVEECLDLLADSAHRKNLELIGSLPTDTHVLVEGDSLRLRQILINLLSNAVKFTHDGEIIVRVEQKDIDAGRIACRFEVTDTGVGVDPGNVDKLFDPFTQEDGSTTRRFGGTGLGLSICKQLVDLMDGEIGVESQPGDGCTFWFSVPLIRDDAAPEQMNTELLAGKRVLIVDDNDTNLETLQHQLDSWRMRVEPASSGPEALGLLGSNVRADRPFDAVLLDMNMPEMDGMQVAAAIRRLEEYAAVPVIVLSSISAIDAGDGRDISEIDAWLTKPVRQSRLFEALSSHIGRPRRTAKILGEPPEPLPATNDSANSDLRVLLAEDNPVNQMVAVGMLNELGHDTTVVADGEEAVEAFREGDFDLVLMDCQMPVLDGFKATMSIRRWEQEQERPPTTIVALTANALSGDRERCLAAGMDDYISKPVSLEELAAAITGALQGGPPEESVEPEHDDSRPRVLIVDDNVINQQVTNAMVVELGYSADLADNGDEALDLMDTQRYALVLMDCHMPVRNGYDTTREIRRRESDTSGEPRIPIVAVTADLMQSNRHRCLSCGMDDYVTKPFTEEQLRRVLNRWLSGIEEHADQPTVDPDGFSALSETMTLASIDRHALEELYQLDSSDSKSMVRDIVVSYCALSTKLMLQLRSAVADADVEQIELLAHSLKGSSGQVGAVLLTALCEQILTGVRNGDLSDAAPLCERAAVEHSAVITALDQELQRIAA